MLLLLGAVASATAEAPAPFATAFTLSSISLPSSSTFSVLRAHNRDQLLSLNLTDVLCEYTAAANLTGTWDAPTCKKLEGVQYWGHFSGHYLSALAMLANATADAQAVATSAAAVASLAAAQAAWAALGGVYAGGYLFPYNISTWNALFKGVSCAPSCVPFYVFHKMLAGMLDQYELLGSSQALAVAVGMASWAKAAAEGVISSGGMGAWQNVLGIEWGGMNDALFALFRVTGDDRWRAAALLFDHYAWTQPLAAGGDPLPGNHANTHIPEVVGDATGFAVTGNATKLAIAVNFFAALNGSHSYATGGSSDGEMWGAALRLGDALNDRTEESCTTYNALKLSRAAFLRDGSALHLDHYERAFFNGLLGNMGVGGPFKSPIVGWIYMLPLGSSDGGIGLRKPWGASDEWLACCWGTLSETFAKIGDSIFFAGADGATLYVGLFASATVAAGGLTWAQTSGWPYDDARTTLISVVAGAPRNYTLAVRVPLWATAKNTATLNGTPLPGGVPQPGSWLAITRVWGPGDALDVFFEPLLRFEQVADDRPEFSTVGAFMWGGTLLAAINSTSTAVPLTSTAPAALAALVTRVPSPPGTLLLSLRTDGEGGRCGSIALVPLADIQFEAYTVYSNTAGFSGRLLNPGAPAVPAAAASDFAPLFGGAAVVPVGAGGTLALRSGGAHSHTSAELNAVLLGDGLVTGVSFSYAYASGAFPGGTRAANFSLVAASFDPCSDAPPVPIATLYKSPPLAGFPYAACNVFTPQVPGGFLAAGNDVWSGSATVAEAEAKCATLPACVAFTFASADVAPTGPVNVYLKSAVDFVAAPGWQAYVSSRVAVSWEEGAPRHAGVGNHRHGSSRRVTMSASTRSGATSAAPPYPPPTCFSPPISVNITGVSLNTSRGVQLNLEFDNYDLNVRLLLPMEMSLSWA